ncbi:MAG: hypothetical protein AAFY41_07710, partial [Bacteroidota bacterium]
GDEDEDIDSGVEVSLDNLSKGKGTVVVSGSESINILDETVVVANLPTTVNGKSYNVNRATVGGTAAGDPTVSIYFYIPESLNQTTPPNGTFQITTESAALDDTYVSIFVIGETDTYNSNSMSTGTVTVTNSSPSTFSFDVVFDGRNITSFDDGSVEVRGAFKF